MSEHSAEKERWGRCRHGNGFPCQKCMRGEPAAEFEVHGQCSTCTTPWHVCSAGSPCCVDCAYGAGRTHDRLLPPGGGRA